LLLALHLLVLVTHDISMPIGVDAIADARVLPHQIHAAEHLAQRAHHIVIHTMTIRSIYSVVHCDVAWTRCHNLSSPTLFD
jgi:hypothetical protein